MERIWLRWNWREICRTGSRCKAGRFASATGELKSSAIPALVITWENFASMKRCPLSSTQTNSDSEIPMSQSNSMGNWQSLRTLLNKKKKAWKRTRKCPTFARLWSHWKSWFIKDPKSPKPGQNCTTSQAGKATNWESESHAKKKWWRRVDCSSKEMGFLNPNFPFSGESGGAV